MVLRRAGLSATAGHSCYVKLLIYSIRCHQDSCTNRDNLQQQ